MNRIRKRYVGKVLGEDFGIVYKEKLGENLWVKIERDAPYFYVFVEDDEHYIYYESTGMIYCERQFPEEIAKAKDAVK